MNKISARGDGSGKRKRRDVGQRREAFKDGSTQGDIQHIPKDWIALWAWRIPQDWFPPLPEEDEGEKEKRQCVE